MISGNLLLKRKIVSRTAGFVLVEAMISLSVLTILGLVLLKMALNVLSPRQWTMMQSVSDAYMSLERASAERIPFGVATQTGNLLWPEYPLTVSTQVQIGTMPSYLPNYPNGVPVIGRVVRTRTPDTSNYPVDSGVGTVIRNPAAMKIWKLQSVLTYTVGGKTYAKSRTIIRSQ